MLQAAAALQREAAALAGDKVVNSNRGGARTVGGRRRKPRKRVSPIVTQVVNTRRTGLRNRRSRANRTAQRLRAEAALGSRGFGFSAVGPMTQVGNTWSDSKRPGRAEGLAGLSMGATETGRLAAAKALHPACDVGPQRWPDKAANESLVLQNTDVFIINANGYTDKNYNCQMWLTNFIDCPLIVSATNDVSNPNSNMTTATCSVGQQKGKSYSFFYSSQWDNQASKHPGVDFQTARITARSITVDLVANATTNQGVVYGSQFTPNISLMPEVGGPNLTSLLKDLVRKEVGKAIKDVEEPQPDEDDVDLLTTVFDRVSFSPNGPAPVGLPPLEAPSGGQSGYRAVFQDFPYTAQQVMQVSPCSYMARADEGIYMPLKHCADTLEYQPTAVECYLSAVVPHQTDNQTTEMNVLISPGWNMGCIIFSGLAIDAVLSVKVITSLELTARSDSQMAKFVEEAPLLDKMAIEHTRAAMGNLPDAFPAKDNVLGGIVDWIANALSMSGIPIVSQIASVGRRVNQMFGNAGTKFLDTIF